MNPKVDFFFEKAKNRQEALEKLRTIVLDCGLNEALKWGCPCYTLQENNIVLIHDFKEYCALLFFKGALLQNAHGLLIQQTEKVQAARQMRFTQLREIEDTETIIRECIYEAIEVEKAGLKVALKKTQEFPMPEEFQKKIAEMPELKTAFESLTPGRQRGYLLFFSDPKQSKTREARIDKYADAILAGKGLND